MNMKRNVSFGAKYKDKEHKVKEIWQCANFSVSATRSYVINCLVLPFPFGVTLL